MEKSEMRISCALALTMAFLTANAWAGTPLPDGPHVVTSGRATSSARADIADLSVTAAFTDETGIRAKERTDAAVALLLASLKRMNVSDSDISASTLAVREDFTYENGKMTKRGIVASRSVKFKLRDVSKIDAVMNAVLDAGVSRIEDPKFTSSSADAIRSALRAEASQKAHASATVLAAGFNAALGKVYSINSVQSTSYAQYAPSPNAGYMNAITVNASKPLSGPSVYLVPELVFEESINVVYSIQP
ncbi:SIMPL domain-containing protein [Lysobacter soyae]|uniref:SIMPL domain-containing protein n=1 Tax=Lysobacter soyae TaxID=2764185 RepID=A0ABX8WNM5_9GAMM|nr:SIMPL domain-containing protein [Lysobacter sp. CJ11]QYR53053.1 SIMPL domain-containing protein [Lysobacter sp. CJ11]